MVGEINLDFGENAEKQIFESFHVLFALDIGDLEIDAWVADYNRDKTMDEFYSKPPKEGKYLTVNISDGTKYSDYLSEAVSCCGEDGFSMQELRDKNQDDWSPEDYKIAKQILVSYVEFVLSGRDSYHDTKKITKSKGVVIIKGLVKNGETSFIKKLKTGSSQETISNKVKELRHEGCEQDQEAGKSKKKGAKAMMSKTKELVGEMLKKGMTKEEIKKSIVDKHQSKNLVKSEGILQGNGKIFEMTDKIDKPIDDFLKASVVTSDVVEWEGIEKSQYDKEGQDLTKVEVENGSNVQRNSGMDCLACVIEEK